jgi:hypothetical protein
MPMMDITDTSAQWRQKMVAEQLPAYCYYQPTAACIPEGTTTEVGSSSGYTTTSTCTAHNDCSGDIPFCYEGLCSSSPTDAPIQSRHLSGSNNSTSTTTYSVDVVPGGRLGIRNLVAI